MSDYPYARRDLFAAPESYEYAACEADDFFEAWRRSRDEVRERLGRLAAAGRPGAASVDSALDESARPLAMLLDEVCRAAQSPPLTREAKATIDALTQKFEMFRRLFAAYGPSLNKAEGAVPAPLLDYVRFGETLAACAEATGSAKYLSTLLKVVDALCSVPGLDGDHAVRLAALIAAERRLVENWARRCGA